MDRECEIRVKQSEIEKAHRNLGMYRLRKKQFSGNLSCVSL